MLERFFISQAILVKFLNFTKRKEMLLSEMLCNKNPTVFVQTKIENIPWVINGALEEHLFSLLPRQALQLTKAMNDGLYNKPINKIKHAHTAEHKHAHVQTCFGTWKEEHEWWAESWQRREAHECRVVAAEGGTWMVGRAVAEVVVTLVWGVGGWCFCLQSAKCLIKSGFLKIVDLQ